MKNARNLEALPVDDDDKENNDEESVDDDKDLDSFGKKDLEDVLQHEEYEKENNPGGKIFLIFIFFEKCIKND